MSMYSTQYLVGAPFAWITAAMRRGMESISLWHCSGVMRAQVALIVAFSSSALLGLAYCIFLVTISHRFSMGLRSGEFAGQLRTGIPWSLNQVLVALALCAGAKSCWKMKLHLHKVGQQQEAWSALKLPGIRLCWPWTSENTVDQHQQMTWHPKPSLTVERTLDLKQRGFCASPLFLQTLGPWFPKEMQNLLSSENIALDHSAAVQSFLSLAQARRFWRCLLFKSGLTQGMRQLKPMSCIRLCVVVLEALTPAAVHSLWISPTFLNGFCFTILSRVRLSLLLVHFFLPHLFLPFASLLMCLDTELCEQPASFAMTFCVLPSLCKVSMVVFWTTVKSAVFPMIGVAYRTRLRDHLKAFAGVLS